VEALPSEVTLVTDRAALERFFRDDAALLP